jgi:DNA-binding transcriptional ArsR family regulator
MRRNDDVDPQLKRALSQALRVEILERIASSPTSPRSISEASGEPISRIAYHTSVLRQTGCVRPTEPGTPDSSDCVYELATLLPSRPRSQLSDSTRSHLLASVLQRIVEQGFKALRAGTLGKWSDSVASCESVLLDQRGWRETQAILEEAARRIAGARAAAGKRLTESTEPGVRVTVALAAFESGADAQPDA